MSRLYACKLEVYIPGSSTAIASNSPHLTRPHLTPTDTVIVESTSTIRASDIGYVDPADGIYPPLLDQAFQIDRTFALPPGADAVGASWGTMTLLNPGGTWDGTASTRSVDGRPVTIFTGEQAFDVSRGIFKDPAFTSLTTVFSGIARGWFLAETALEVPLTDATYYIENPIQNAFFAGTGGYNGTSALTGTPKPKTRGGNSTYPVSNITPIQIDTANLVYQYNDCAGTVVALYEGGKVTYAIESTLPDTTDLYANPPSPGHYRTDNSRGLFRLGTAPSRPITADVTGQFPVVGIKTSAADIALAILTDEIVVSSTYIDTASFTALAAAYPWVCGYYFPQETAGTTAVSLFLRSIGAKLISTRAGKLRAIALRATPTGTVPAAALTIAEIIKLTPTRLPAPLDPPADLWRIGWNKNHTVQSTDVFSDVTAARKTYIATDWPISSFFSSAINAAFRRPSRPPIVETANLVAENAATNAAALGDLWCVRRRLFAMEVPISIGLRREIGDVIQISYPMDDLSSGKLAIVVGEQYRSTDATITLQVLV